MPWLPIYATELDIQNLFAYLNDEEEVAFLVADGPGKWIAKKRGEYTGDIRYCIWHVPSGPLPLLRQNGQEQGLVNDPWQGWQEERTGADSTTPYFGAGHPGIIWLNARAGSKRKKNGIGLSSFEWIGNWYRVIGNAAPETTEKFWKRMGRQIKKGASRIPRAGAYDGPHPEIWALPDALTRIQDGAERDDNP
jgi:hypothetical protein